MEETIQALTATGLSTKEAEAYLDLHTYGESQTGKICERTQIPSSYIYIILSNLAKKGLITYKVVNNIKVYCATDPGALQHLFEEKEIEIQEKKQRLLTHIKKLKAVAPRPDRLSDFKYFEGIRGIKSLYTEIINNWKKKGEYYIASAPKESFEKLEGFFKEIVHKRRVEDEVRVKILVNQDSKEWGETRKKMKYTEVRYLKSQANTEYGVIDDYFFLISYGKEAYGLLIKDKNFAQTYKNFFTILWENATP